MCKWIENVLMSNFVINWDYFHFKFITIYVCISFELIEETSNVKQELAKSGVRHLVLYSCVIFYLIDKWSNILPFLKQYLVILVLIMYRFLPLSCQIKAPFLWYAMQNNIQLYTKKFITFDKIVYNFTSVIQYILY